MKGCLNIAFILVLGISICSSLLCLANGLQRVIAYGDWVHGIQTFGIGCVIALIVLFVGANLDE